jgi:hypothetical protein
MHVIETVLDSIAFSEPEKNLFGRSRNGASRPVGGGVVSPHILTPVSTRRIHLAQALRARAIVRAHIAFRPSGA